MNSWEYSKLGVFCNVKGGKRLPKGGTFSDSGYPYIRARDIRDGKVTFGDPVFISEEIRQKLKRYTVKKNDVCITIVGINIGDTGIIPSFLNDANLTENAAKLTEFKGIYPLFLNYYLQSSHVKELMKLVASGAAQDKLGLYKIKEIPVPVPPLPIQQKIAAILSAYDELIENNKQRIGLLEKMAEEIYREWFVRFRFPRHDKMKFVKGVPEGWEIATLGDIANFTMGQSPKSEFYNETGDGLPFNQGVGTYGVRFPKKVKYCSVNGRKAQKGDILFSVRAPVGRLNIADCDMIIGRGLAAVRHKKLQNSYLFHLLKVAFASEDIIGNGAIFNSVGKNELQNFKIFQPAPDLTQQFEKVASKIDQQISLLINSVESLSKTRNLLLPRLISGKLSVTDLNIHFPPSMAEEQNGSSHG